jgi:hypothetical protein
VPGGPRAGQRRFAEGSGWLLAKPRLDRLAFGRRRRPLLFHRTSLRVDPCPDRLQFRLPLVELRPTPLEGGLFLGQCRVPPRKFLFVLATSGLQFTLALLELSLALLQAGELCRQMDFRLPLLLGKCGPLAVRFEPLGL